MTGLEQERTSIEILAINDRKNYDPKAAAAIDIENAKEATKAVVISGVSNAIPGGILTRGFGKILGTIFGLRVASLTSRANTVHGALDPIAASRRTTAVLETTDGSRIIASGGRDLSPAQRAVLSL